MDRTNSSSGSPLGRVLVVEDHAEWRPLIQLILAEAGYEVTITESSEQAVEAVPLLRPDVILLGLSHWRTRAVHAVARLREVLQNPVPIILVSADLPTKSAIQPDEYFDGYLHKDEVINGLADCVRVYTEGRMTSGDSH